MILSRLRPGALALLFWDLLDDEQDEAASEVRRELVANVGAELAEDILQKAWHAWRVPSDIVYFPK